VARNGWQRWRNGKHGMHQQRSGIVWRIGMAANQQHANNMARNKRSRNVEKRSAKIIEKT